MKTSSAKNKGRLAQKQVCKDLLDHVYTTLEPGDIRSCSMGAGGLDAILSPAAKRILDLSIEVKNVEALSVVKTFWDHYNKYANTASLKLLAHKKNRSEMLATLRWSDLLTLLSLAKNDTTTKQ